MSIGEKTLVCLAALALTLVLVVGAVPNVMAYDATDTEILSVTLTFGDGNTTTLTNGGVYYLNDNQTTVTAISVYAQYFRYNATETILKRTGLEFTDPEGTIDTGGISADEDSWALDIDNETVLETGYYNVTHTHYVDIDGNHTWVFFQYFIENGTFVYHDDPTDLFTITLVSNGTPGSGTDDTTIGMGDWVWFQMVLGFIGVIGFVGTPMVTAKLMSSKNPITLMSAFLICMITFGVFIYVFLLGGS